MRWTIKPKPSEDKIKHLAQALQVEEFVAQLLVQRGIETYEDAKLFFRPSLEHLHDPYLMKDMDKAVLESNKLLQMKNAYSFWRL
jgi:single-stranded-DNA-specific exonuclease